jgi:D-glycero-D-manno-heptose 1,7-bisphosphate phosphatase
VKGLIFLDRDGVLNRMVVHPEHGTVDSPMNADEVKLTDTAIEAVTWLGERGFGLCIVSKQPAAAKGKTTRVHLDAVHACVLDGLGEARRFILGSHLCFHRAEDGCSCRKPKPGLLAMGWRANPGFDLSRSWMVGDGLTDVQAGHAFGVKTALLAPDKLDIRTVAQNHGVKPDLWANNLLEFTRRLSSI